MSAIDNDNWCYVSRLAVESLGWDLDKNRKGPEDDRPYLVGYEEDGTYTIADDADEETVKTHWISSDMFVGVDR